jgi:hypothetical protein
MRSNRADCGRGAHDDVIQHLDLHHAGGFADFAPRPEICVACAQIPTRVIVLCGVRIYVRYCREKRLNTSGFTDRIFRHNNILREGSEVTEEHCSSEWYRR